MASLMFFSASSLVLPWHDMGISTQYAVKPPSGAGFSRMVNFWEDTLLNQVSSARHLNFFAVEPGNPRSYSSLASNHAEGDRVYWQSSKPLQNSAIFYAVSISRGGYRKKSQLIPATK